MRGCSQGGRAWLLTGGACVVAHGGRGACVVAHGGGIRGCSPGACVVAHGGACMVAHGGGMRGYSWGGGDMHGCSRGHAWLLLWGCMVFSMRYSQ